jgi:YVTN family beta-propeller protein
VADVFLSYSRRDGAFVQRLGAALRESGKEVWVDVEGIRDADVFREALRRAVESSDAFVFVISPDSVGSSFCVEEVEHAASLNKRIVPVALRPVTDEEVPEGVRVRNWIPAGKDWDFETTVNRVLKALDTDLEWEREHSRLTVKAIEWEQSGRNRSFVLRGADLKSAERWLSAGAEKDPGPTALEREYLAASRSRVRRGRALATAVTAVVVGALAALAALLLAPGAGVHVGPNSLASIDPRTNSLVASIPVGTRPGALTFGSGSLWVANVDDQTVSRVDPATLSTLRNLSVSAPPTGLAASANAIWVAESNPQASTISVTSIDPQFDSFGPTTQFGNIVPGGSGAVAAQSNTVWIAPSSGLLTRLNAADRRVERRIDPNSGPSAIALGDGAVWLTDTEANNVTRVDPGERTTSIPVGNGPSAIAVAASGVWVADSLDNALVRINPSTNSIVARIRVGRAPAGVAAGAGSIWVANSGDGTISRIDPRTDNVTATIIVGDSPQAITIADGRVWVTVDAQTIRSDLARGGGTFRMESQLDPGTMDPALAGLPPSWELLYAECAKLVNYPDKPGLAGSRLIPEVARSLPARSADGKAYTFTIRPGFRFSPPSSEPVTAETFRYTIERSLSPRMGNGDRGFADIVGEAAYSAGKAPHISGITARGDTLMIRLRAPEPDFPARLTQPEFCAVPTNTPINPKGERAIPSAGPYYLASYTPGQGIVLERNPNYHGSRPHSFARIEVTTGVSWRRAVADVTAGAADYTDLQGPGAPSVRNLIYGLAAPYGPSSLAARQGRQRYFVNPQPEVDYFNLNTHRPLFADVRMRQAVNYAVDRRALAQVGEPYVPLPDRPTDHYIPPGMPGYTDARVYPLTPDPAKATALAHGGNRTAVLYTCDIATCAQQAEILKNDLAAIGLQVRVRKFPVLSMWARMAKPGEPFDIGTYGWVADHPDPDGMLPAMLENPNLYPTFDDPTYQRRLIQTSRLTGPRRYLAYRKLDLDLARNAAPLIAFGTALNSDFFSARIGCQTYGFYGMDLDALCIRPGAR